MPNPRNKANHRRETDRLMDMTQNELREELTTALRGVDADQREFVLNEATRLFTVLDIASRILGLCTECLQRLRTNQWAKYCYVTCQPARASVPLDDDPDGTLRLVYPSPPTIRQLRRDAGLDNWKPKLQSTPATTTNPPFTGVRITSRLHLSPSDEHPGMWDICGKESHLSGLATPGELLALAHLILQNFQE